MEISSAIPHIAIMRFRLREFIPKQRKPEQKRKQLILVEGITVELQQKSIRNINIAVLPPDGRVRVSAPLRSDIEAVKSFIIAKMAWIKKSRDKFRNAPKLPALKYISGEEHFLFGEKLLLEVNDTEGRPGTSLKDGVIMLRSKIGSGIDERKRILDNLYKRKLRELIPAMIGKWEPVMNVSVREFGVKLMKTRWGTCNIGERRIWLNLELAKKPAECIEYIVVHELVHLLERNHTRRFYSLMSHFLPDWKERKVLLNSFPFPHEDWGL